MTETITPSRGKYEAMLAALKLVAIALPLNKSTVKSCYAINNIHRDAVHAALAQQADVPEINCWNILETCEWTQDPDNEMGDTYHSSCGESWSFVDGGPKENRVSYCHHCSKPVKLAASPKGGV